MVDAIKAPGRWAAYAEPQQRALRADLAEWVSSRSGPGTDEQPYVKNKLAQVVYCNIM